MEKKKIQFGHTQGIFIIVLGFILLASQALISFHMLAVLPQTENGAGVTAASRGERAMSFIPGILGVAAICIGGYFIAQEKLRRDTINPPAKTKSGFPM